ncbi:hypothetical protein Tco_1303893 [Tanacetum coccineum]
MTLKNIKDLDIYFGIPGVPPIHASEMTSFMFDRQSNMYKNFIDTSSNMAKSFGLIANSLARFEERAINSLTNGKCITSGPTPPIYLIGPLIASEQLKEMAIGIESSGQRFLWVVRDPPPDDEYESYSGGKDTKCSVLRLYFLKGF